MFDTFLFDFAKSLLTGGFALDAKVVLMALVLFGVIALGSEKIYQLILSAAATAKFERAKKYLGLMQSDETLYEKDSAEYAYHRGIYQSHMNSAVSQSIAARQAAFQPEVMFTGGDIAESSEESRGYTIDSVPSDHSEGPGFSFRATASNSLWPDDDPGPDDDDNPGW